MAGERGPGPSERQLSRSPDGLDHVGDLLLENPRKTKHYSGLSNSVSAAASKASLQFVLPSLFSHSLEFGLIHHLQCTQIALTTSHELPDLEVLRADTLLKHSAQTLFHRIVRAPRSNCRTTRFVLLPFRIA